MTAVLVTGGSGFIGANLAIDVKQSRAGCRVVALDNLNRRGSELNLPRLKEAGVEYLHGDVRQMDDLRAAGKFDVLLECSAEPSVLAGLGGSPAYVVQTNLCGTINCLERCRELGAAILFLSTSRVYPTALLNRLVVCETESRFQLTDNQSIPGASTAGISEEFPMEGCRSLYGATKLASELLLREYVEAYRIPGVILRCGVVAGPWQMGKVDQGFVSLWVAAHVFHRPLSYIGFGGTGKQVRDLVHLSDLSDLVRLFLADMAQYSGRVFNVGGGSPNSVSLRELTDICAEATSARVDVSSVAETRPADVRLYVTDCAQVMRELSWAPKRSVSEIVEDVARWMVERRHSLAQIFGA